MRLVVARISVRFWIVLAVMSIRAWKILAMITGMQRCKLSNGIVSIMREKFTNMYCI